MLRMFCDLPPEEPASVNALGKSPFPEREWLWGASRGDRTLAVTELGTDWVLTAFDAGSVLEGG